MLLGLATLLAAQNSITGEYPCSTGTFFDTSSLTCSSCPTNYEVSSNDQSCVCPRQHQLASDAPDAACTPCAAGTAARFDRTAACLACPGANCVCANNEHLVESAAGAFSCVGCPPDQYGYLGLAAAGTTQYDCTPCPIEGQEYNSVTGVCACPAGEVSKATFCVNQADWSATTNDYSPDSMDRLTYRDVESASGSADGTINVNPSDTFTTLLPQALYECLKTQEARMCQILANLCVYKMYDQSQASCKVLADL